MMRSWFLVCLCVILLGTSLPAGACVGARALAMGGAFTGLADDLSATYWNPAALPDLERGGVSAMHVFEKAINYQDYLTYVLPLTENSALGLSYIKFQMLPSIEMYDASASWTQHWYWLSLGTRISEKTSLGANVKLTRDDPSLIVSGVAVPVSADTDLGFDVALYHHAGDRVTFGLLVQGVNRPVTTVDIPGLLRGEITWIQNWRPGIAIREPGQNMIYSFEVYDALDKGDARALRIGLEKTFPNGLALRAGRYAAGDVSGLTLGAGLSKESWAIDVALLGGDLDNTWVASATAKF